MNSFAGRWLLALAPLAVLLAPCAVAAPPGPLKLPAFEALAAKATESVNITLDSALLGTAASFLDPGDPDEAATKALIAGLKGIYVRSYTFDREFAYPSAEVDMVRKQLAAPGWQQLVGVRSTREHTNVDIYVSVDRGQANGLTIIASEPREFTIVNIVGAIDLQKLHSLEGKFGVPKLSVPDKPSQDKPPGSK
jgi:hypothetical protein